jgi:SAM-dependent methyltransferase
MRYDKFNTGWREIETSMGIDLKPILRKRNPVIIDLGCGDGQALRDLLKTTKGRATLIGVSAAFLKQWTVKKQNDTKIRYRIMGFHQLKRKFPENYADFIYSYYGVSHESLGTVAENVWHILKPHGLFVFNTHRLEFELHKQQIERLFKIKKVIFMPPGQAVVHLEKRQKAVPSIKENA